MIQLRLYTQTDYNALMKLFYDTVHMVNQKDYNAAQLDCWAPRIEDKARWQQKLESNIVLIAQKEDEVVGFASLTQDGCFDHLYVHHGYQRQGIGAKLADAIERMSWRGGHPHIYAEVSITARPFFITRGYITVKKQNKQLGGETFINYIMEKELSFV